MMWKKCCAALLTVAMTISLAACGAEPTGTDTQTSSNGQSTNVTDSTGAARVTDGNYGGLVPLDDANDPITYKFFVRDPGTSSSKNNPVLQKITELTGITIEFEFLVGDLDQTVGVMIAGEDYPDVILVEAAKFTDAGAFIPMEDYLPQYGNLYEHYARYENSMTVADGHHYILEIYGAYEYAPPTFSNGGVGFFIQKAV